MKLSAEDAVVDIRKLRDYCLDPHHPRGRHKARVFAEVLGLTQGDAEMIRQALLEALEREEAVLMDTDAYGQRFQLDFEMTGPAGTAVVRSAWIVRSDESFPRLTTCYVR